MREGFALHGLMAQQVWVSASAVLLKGRMEAGEGVISKEGHMQRPLATLSMMFRPLVGRNGPETF